MGTDELEEKVKAAWKDYTLSLCIIPVGHSWVVVKTDLGIRFFTDEDNGSYFNFFMRMDWPTFDQFSRLDKGKQQAMITRWRRNK